jgi:DNA excision repair protein ERCC-2
MRLMSLLSAWRSADQHRRGSTGTSRFCVPTRSLLAAQNLVGAVTERMAEAPLSMDETLRFFFDTANFVALVEQFGDIHYSTRPA